jgi:hypothetical protein
VKQRLPGVKLVFLTMTNADDVAAVLPTFSNSRLVTSSCLLFVRLNKGYRTSLPWWRKKRSCTFAASTVSSAKRSALRNGKARFCSYSRRGSQ